MDLNLTTVRTLTNPPAHHSHHFSCLCGKRHAELRQLLSNNELTTQQLQRTAPYITALIHLYYGLIYVPEFSRLLWVKSSLDLSHTVLNTISCTDQTQIAPLPIQT